MSLHRAFIIAGLGLANALVSDGGQPTELLEVGQRLKAAKTLDFLPYATVNAGEQGTVDYINSSTGWTEIKLDAYHAGLAPWGNHVWIVPYETDDVTSGLEVV